MHIHPVTFTSEHPGPKLLVTGAVHGDEICGPQAIAHILERFNSGELALEKGSVTFVQVCNPRAYEANKRFIECNLNRGFRRHEQPTMYEHHLMNELAPFLESCDVILDIHSYAAGGPTFAFRGEDELRMREEPFVPAAGLDHVIYGWNEAYAASGIIKDPADNFSVARYARTFGVIGITIECGQHRDSNATPIAIRAIEGMLSHCGLIADLKFTAPAELHRTRMKKAFYKSRAGVFEKQWRHLDKITHGEVIARFEDGEILTAPFTGRIVLPNANCAMGHEWFYVGVEE